MSNGNVTPIRQPPVSVDPQHGWVWDGSNWQWWPHAEHPIWPPQPPFPCPPQPGCGPQPMPPSCFSQVAKADACWDQSQSLYNLVSKVVMDIFTKNPGIIPPPPATAGSGPIIGVTDGSTAAPGEVGELLTQTTNGTMSTGTPGITGAAITLTPGDWNVQSEITISDLTAGFYFNGMLYSLMNGTTVLAQFSLENNFTSNVGGWVSGIFPTNLAAVSTSVPLLLTGSATIYGIFGTGTGSAAYSIVTKARRMR